MYKILNIYIYIYVSHYITMKSPWLMVEPHWISFQINSLWCLKPCVFTQVKLMSRSNWVKPNLADLVGTGLQLLMCWNMLEHIV